MNLGLYLQVNTQQSINALAARGWSVCRIARDLGVHRATVARCLRPKPEKPVKAPARPDSRSSCERYREHIEDALEVGLSAQRLFQDLCSGLGFTGSYLQYRFKRGASVAGFQWKYPIA